MTNWSDEQLRCKVACFLDRIYSLADQDEETAIDEVLGFLDDALLAKDFALCDKAIESVNFEKVPASLLVSFLMISKAAKEHLPSRDVFFNKALEAVSREWGQEAADALLQKHR